MITIKEEFIGSPKWLRAIEIGGSDAVVMWLVLKAYAAANPTDGFIPADDIERLPGKPKNWRKALTALVECGRRNRDGTRSAGLVDPEEHGVQLHDYLDHAPSSAEVEERRRKERERKRLQRGTSVGTNRGTRPGTTGGTEDGTSGGTTDGTEPGTGGGTAHGVPAPPRARPRVPTQPYPSPPTPPNPPSGGGRIPCPPDLAITDDQRVQLAMMPGVPDWFVDQVTALVRTQFADGSDPRTLEQWRRTVVSYITSRWSDPKNRVQPTTPSGQPPARPVARTRAPAQPPEPEGPTAWERLAAEREEASVSAPKSKAEIIAEFDAEVAAHG